MIQQKDEKKYLERVQKQILKEIDEQNETLRRIPLEYKGRYSDVKWGDEDLVQDLTKTCAKRLEVISNLEMNPYFGKFEFISPELEKLKSFYLGKTDISDNNSYLVLDWRNPICTLYYDHSLGKVSYESPKGTIAGELLQKLQIIIKQGILESIREVDLVSDDQLLQPYLDVNADNRMKVIIASIQSEQNGIIRRPINENLIVQGVAGSGKTSVALHRIAYLLYDASDKYNASNFAIIAPNKYFLNYISSILPDLDTKAAREFTFEEIAKKVICEEGFTYESSSDELNRHLLNNESSKVKKFKGTLEYKEVLLKFLNDYFDSCVQKGIEVDGIEVLSIDEIKSQIRPRLNYSEMLNDFVKRNAKGIKSRSGSLSFSFSKPLLQQMKEYPLKSPERNEIIARMDSFKSQLEQGCQKELKQILKPLLISPINLYKLFLENIDKYINMDSKELADFRNSTLKALKNKTIPYEDLAPIAFLSTLYNGKNGFESYVNVTIDEAQDYSLFQFDILKSLFEKSTFSIYGDQAQAVYSYRSIDSWEEVNNSIFNDKCNILNMTKSYRTTKEITVIANHVLEHLNLQTANPVIRNGEKTIISSIDDQMKNSYYSAAIRQLQDKNYKSIGVICKTEKEMQKVGILLQESNISFNYMKSSDEEYKSGVSLLTSYLAKGLEFDAVIITDASEKNYNSNINTDMHLLYVAMTRALHELNILYTGQLTLPLQSSSQKIVEEENKGPVYIKN